MRSVSAPAASPTMSSEGAPATPAPAGSRAASPFVAPASSKTATGRATRARTSRTFLAAVQEASTISPRYCAASSFQDQVSDPRPAQNGGSLREVERRIPTRDRRGVDQRGRRLAVDERAVEKAAQLVDRAERDRCPRPTSSVVPSSTTSGLPSPYCCSHGSTCRASQRRPIPHAEATVVGVVIVLQQLPTLVDLAGIALVMAGIVLHQASAADF